MLCLYSFDGDNIILFNWIKVERGIMFLIEGFGDEVIIFLGILLVLFIICLVWISINIRDIFFFSVIIIELIYRRNRNIENIN